VYFGHFREFRVILEVSYYCCQLGRSKDILVIYGYFGQFIGFGSAELVCSSGA
jgi:hypothetical protein